MTPPTDIFHLLKCCLYSIAFHPKSLSFCDLDTVPETINKSSIQTCIPKSVTVLGSFGFEVVSASDFCRVGQSCNLRNCPQLCRREGSYDRYLRMDDYCRRKDDSYFDRYRDSFDGRGPRAKGEVPAVFPFLGESHSWTPPPPHKGLRDPGRQTTNVNVDV